MSRKTINVTEKSKKTPRKILLKKQKGGFNKDKTPPSFQTLAFSIKLLLLFTQESCRFTAQCMYVFI